MPRSNSNISVVSVKRSPAGHSSSSLNRNTILQQQRVKSFQKRHNMSGGNSLQLAEVYIVDQILHSI